MNRSIMMMRIVLLLCCHRLQSGMNLQICFVNDSGSDKDSDADDSRTETSLDTPLSPMVTTRTHTRSSLEPLANNSKLSSVVYLYSNSVKKINVFNIYTCSLTFFLSLFFSECN